jgi:hypothetical protein
MNEAGISIRRATELDQPAIRALARSGQLSRTDVKWPSCWVASTGQRIVGIVQMRSHSDGSHELGPLVVSKEVRGQGIAGRLIDALVAAEPGPIWMVTAQAFAAVCKRWGFSPDRAAVSARRGPTQPSDEQPCARLPHAPADAAARDPRTSSCIRHDPEPKVSAAKSC